MVWYPNGFVVQTIDDKNCPVYFGIEGRNWEMCESGELNDYYKNQIDLSWQYPDHIDCCNDFDFIRRCIESSYGTNYRILFCETDRPQPCCPTDTSGFDLVGYDYAYAGGSFYSCVKNDLVLRKFDVFRNIYINRFGLIETEKDLKNFIRLRSEIIPQNELLFEKGDFISYRLYLVKKSYFGGIDNGRIQHL